ncbi:5,10-methylene tetrahydromethanopterin reductase [Microbacterium mangrovi]|uniref:5,10-methylene tetrahydromethanopterin reductase n=1 Tax=Microbacterium mangrovi TaxID=1348253 RepID=A0A0B1ZXT7_9MICO|nr:5,10-methylene tetrahydromethanopterin reductase [Microbacterium mangrovi]
MDYGHPLRFGTFITPVNAPPQRPVELARLTERLGYDLVTFQDHPYQPRFHDTWTLMSYVAAATTTVRIAPDVANLPMRQPAVLARSAASLDLLTGGRLDLGLGAGGFWDAIEAMGGRRLTPGQAVDALAEAIDIMRGVWDPDAGFPLHGGDYYPVRGAKRGPRPAHPIPLWIGARGPRMLRLTGRTGDGWLPSLGYLTPIDLAAANARIDDAAADAGRDPRAVERLANVAGTEGVDDLVHLALEHGISTFISTGDDPAEMQRRAEEVNPAVRAAVAAERAR